jgi:hypothetical protein
MAASIYPGMLEKIEAALPPLACGGAHAGKRPESQGRSS